MVDGGCTQIVTYLPVSARDEGRVTNTNWCVDRDSSTVHQIVYRF